MKQEDSLQKLSGLSDVDPIYGFLGMVDELFCDYSWNEIHQRIPKDKLLLALFEIMGYPLIKVKDRATPVINDNISSAQVDELQEFLKRNDEIYFSELVGRLKEKINPVDIRCTLMWIFVNIDDLRERETGPRSIFAGNVIDGPFI